MQAQEALSLTDAQFGPFVTRLKQLQATRRQTQQQEQRLLRTLQQLASRGDTSDEDLEARLQELDEQRTHAAAAVRNAHAAVADVLDVRQRVRLQTFERRMERRQIELLMRARRAWPTGPATATAPEPDTLTTCILGAMTVWCAGLTEPACRRRRRGHTAAVLLALAVAQAAAAAQSPDTPASALGAQLQQKIDDILRHAGDTSPAAHRTTLLEPEINAYLQFQGAALLPEGLTDPTISIGDARAVTVKAVIDLDAIRDQRARNWLDPLQYLGGQMPITARGTVSLANGAAQIAVEQITISGVLMPVAVLQELVGYYTRTPDQPQGTRLDQPIPLPYRISELRLAPGEAVVVQ